MSLFFPLYLCSWLYMPESRIFRIGLYLTFPQFISNSNSVLQDISRSSHLYVIHRFNKHTFHSISHTTNQNIQQVESEDRNKTTSQTDAKHNVLTWKQSTLSTIFQCLHLHYSGFVQNVNLYLTSKYHASQHQNPEFWMLTLEISIVFFLPRMFVTLIERY